MRDTNVVNFGVKGSAVALMLKSSLLKRVILKAVTLKRVLCTILI